MEESSSPTPPPTPPPDPPDAGVAPSADPHERIDGLRRWINQVDGTVKARTYIAGGLIALALLGAGVAIGLANSKEEGASQDQVDQLQANVSQLQAESSTAGTDAEQNVDALAKAVDALITEIEDFQGNRQQFERQLSQIRDDIRQLRQQSGGGGASP